MTHSVSTGTSNASRTPVKSGAPLIPRAAFNTTTTRELAEAMTKSSNPSSVNRRWGIVHAIHGAPDFTVDVTIGGTTVANLAYDSAYVPTVGEVVMLDIVGTDTVVVGTTAPAQTPLYTTRTGTITAVTTNGTAPGSPTSVNVKLTDVTPTVSLTDVPFVSEYFPTVGDTVQLGQSNNTYLVLGAIGRVMRRPTGDIEATMLDTAKPNTLLMNGQAVSRTAYAALWAWAQLNGLVAAGLFGTGDGSTTFTLPDYQGRVPVGAGTLGSDTYNVGDLVGVARAALTTDQMPAHNHGVAATTTTSAHGHSFSDTTTDAGSHAHGGNTTTQSANHTHTLGIENSGSEATGYGLAAPGVTQGFGDRAMVTGGVTTTSSNNVSHIHGISTAGDHTHSVSGTTSSTTVAATTTVTQNTVGGSTPVDVRQPAFVVNWLIWY